MGFQYFFAWHGKEVYIMPDNKKSNSVYIISIAITFAIVAWDYSCQRNLGISPTHFSEASRNISDGAISSQ